MLRRVAASRGAIAIGIAAAAVAAALVIGSSGLIWAGDKSTRAKSAGMAAADAVSASGAVSLWSSTAVPATITDPDTQSVELGVKFQVATAGLVNGVRFYKGPKNTGTHVGNLWATDGRRLATVTFAGETASGWQSATFPEPVAVSSNTTYVVSYFAPVGRYSANTGYFSANAHVNGPLTALRDGANGGNGVYSYASRSTFPTATYQATNYWVDVLYSATSASPSPTGSAPPTASPTATSTATPRPSGTATASPTRVPGGWPGPGNTGVPAGTSLSNYTGSCDIRTNGLVIDAKTVNCSLLIYASNVTIRRSKVNGTVNTNSSSASLRIEDSEVDGGAIQSQTVGTGNVTVLRSNIHGSQHSVHCDYNCHVEDSWLHGQYDGSSRGWHQNGFLTNGGGNHVLRHNTIHCVGGCTADIALIPDGNINNVLVERNLLVASPNSSYCIYGGAPARGKPGRGTNIVFKDNVVQRGTNRKCGSYGPVTYFDSAAAGNRWVNNTWDDGTTLPPAL